ncbi:hypothetical protein ACFWYW_24030 [Nonomuraea sp. NPDC059023]|uniref:hypothetical protein n=1 Tax=unclassified Nonomuraea TaxID=2593643 RepID=UPI00369E35DF
MTSHASLPIEARSLIAQINKKHGEGALVTGSEMSVPARYTSGSIGLDVILGGGWPANQWAEVIGKESQGKTFIALKTVAANQQRDPKFTTLWIAAEHFDVDQAHALGVDTDRVIVMPTQDMELAFETMLSFAASKSIDLIVLDSYPALIPGEEADKTMEDAVVAVGARLVGKFFRKMGAASKRALDGTERPMFGLIINQYRDAIGQFSPHGTPQTTPGGKAKNYFYYVRLEVKRDEVIDEARHGKGKTRVGQTVKLRTLKNKAASPGQVASLDVYFRDAPNLGFLRGDYDSAKELLTYGVLYDLIKRAGAYYSIGERRWQGKDALLQDLRAESDLQESLRAGILAASAKPDRDLITTEAS